MTHRIGILTALADVELPQTLSAFGIDPSTPPTEQEGTTRYWKTTLARQDQHNLEIIISTLTHSGNVEALFETTRMINIFEPEFMALVGIACGIKSKCNLADVVVSEAIYAYQYVKSTKRGDLNRQRILSPPKIVNPDINMMFQNKQLEVWHENFRNVQAKIKDENMLPRLHVHSPSQHKGIIASGDIVMADGKLLELQQREDRIRAGEMEGYGFATGCADSRPSIPWLIVRGISDFGDDSKDGDESPDGRTDPEKPKKDEYHHIAALAAATFLRTFLEVAYTPQSIWTTKLSEADFRITEDKTDIKIKDSDDQHLRIEVDRTFKMQAQSSGTYRFRRNLDGAQIEARWTKFSLSHGRRDIALRLSSEDKLIESTAQINVEKGDLLIGSLSSFEKISKGRGFYSLGLTSSKALSKFCWEWDSERKPKSLDVFYCSEHLNATNVKEKTSTDVGDSSSGVIYVLRWKTSIRRNKHV